MKFRVELSERAETDLQNYYLVAAKHAPETAALWFNRFAAALETLALNPDRCTLAPENDLVDEAIYQFPFGKNLGRFRTLFTIIGDRVVILHVRRGTMDKATKSELLG